MIPGLLIALIAIDFFLVVWVMRALRRPAVTQQVDVNLLREIDHEHRMLKELRDSVHQDLERRYGDMKLLYEKVARMATETEMELKSASETLSHDLEQVVIQARTNLDVSLQDFDRRRIGLSSLLKKSQEERFVLQKALSRAEKLSKFFDERIPYQQVLEEIEDKKYIDARHLLAKGLAPMQVAKELGLPEAEVHLISTMR